MTLALAGCKEEAKDAPSAAPAVDLAPVPEPEGLAAELVVRKPGEAWTKLRDTGGGTLRLLPQSFGLLVSTLLGLPPAVADAIDPDIAAAGAAVDDGKGGLGWVIAVHVRGGRDLIARLSAGADAAYGAREDAVNALTLLEPKPGKAPSEVALAVTGNYLLASTHATDLTKVGPFAARTLAKREPPKEPIAVAVKKRALAGPLAAWVQDEWRQKKSELEKLDKENHGGRAPDFGDPLAALAGIDKAVEGVVAVLESSASGRITVDPLGDRLDARVEIVAEEGGAASELMGAMAVGDAAPLAALPQTTPIAVLTRSTAATREASAKSFQEGLASLLGDRLTAPDKSRLEQTFADLGKGRGDVEVYALVLDQGKGGLVYAGSVGDAKALDAGAKGAFKLLGVKAISEPIRQFIGETSVKQSSVQLPGLGKAERALITVKPSGMRMATDKTGKASAEPQNLDVLWQIRDDKVYGVLSFDSVPILGSLVAAQSDPKTTHAAEERVKAALDRVTGASFVVLVQPHRLGLGQSATQTPSSPVVLSLGKSGERGYLRVDADQVALETLLKSLTLGR
jgi:hypothetical protein